LNFFPDPHQHGSFRPSFVLAGAAVATAVFPLPL